MTSKMDYCDKVADAITDALDQIVQMTIDETPPERIGDALSGLTIAVGATLGRIVGMSETVTGAPGLLPRVLKLVAHSSQIAKTTIESGEEANAAIAKAREASRSAP